MPETVYGIEALKPNFDPDRPAGRSRAGRTGGAGNRRRPRTGNGDAGGAPRHATLSLASAVFVVIGLAAGLVLLLDAQHTAALWTGVAATFVAAIGVWFGLRALITGPGRRRGFVSALVCAVANPFAVTAMLQWAEGWVIA